MPSRRSVLAGIGAATLAAFGVGAAGAQSDDGDDPEELAAVRVAHASPDAPAVDVEVDGDEVLADLSFRRVSDYLTLDPGAHDVRVTEAGGDSEAFYDETLELDPGAYTVVASGETDVEEQTVQVDVLEDAPAEVDDDTARVRAVHASPDIGPVDVTVDDAARTAFDSLAEFDVETVALDAGESDVEIRPNDGDGVARIERLLSLAAGESYTVFVLGYATPEEASTEGLGLVVVKNRTTVPTPDDDDEDEDDEDDEDEDDDDDEDEDDDDGDDEDEDEEEDDDEDEDDDDDDDDEDDEDEDEEGRGPPPGRGEGRGPPEWAGPSERAGPESRGARRRTDTPK